MSARGAAGGLPAPLRGVLFDLDGVLLDSSRAWFRVVLAGRERFGGGPAAWADFEATFGQGVEADRDQFFPDLSVAELDAFYAERFPAELSHLAVMPGAVALLEGLRERGLARAVVTNTAISLVHEVLRGAGLAAHLDVVTAAGEAAEKPAPDLIHLALSRLGLTVGEVVYVGDSDSDRAASSAAGVFMVGYQRPGDLRVERLTDLLALLPSSR